MNDLQIFNNEEFGQIRTVVDDDGVWFVAKDISSKLGYSKTANMVKNVDSDDRKTIESSVLEPSRGGVTSIINESGLYAAIFGSKQANAKKFKKWVTSEVLPQIRRTGGYQLPQTTDEKIQLLALGHTELKQEIEEVKSDLERLKEDLPILPIEADRITEAVRRKGTMILGGKSSAAYKNRSIRHKVYSSIYSTLKYNFAVRSYKSIKRCECDKAVEIVGKYEAPYFLQTEIESENSQMSIF